MELTLNAVADNLAGFLKDLVQFFFSVLEFLGINLAEEEEEENNKPA